MKNISVPTVIVSALLSVASALIVTAGMNRPTLAVPTQSKTGAVVATSQEQVLIDTVTQAEPAVVSVIISKDLPVMERSFEQGPFGLRIPQLRQNGTELQEVGGGTAFFVSSDGLLMTNRHVVADSEARYTVLLNDGRRLDADVVAVDRGNDIALLKVSGKDFPALKFSDSAPRLAQQVIAIGNALGEFRNTVSIGVISGLSRSIVAGSGRGETEILSSIIQTDAAINQGNSGGPLLSTDGKVIGMNTAIASGAQNVGFAIPAEDLKRALESFQKNGKILRPYIGVRYIPITAELKRDNNLPYDYGVLIPLSTSPDEPAILDGSPAEKADLKAGDIILEVDGQKLDSEHQLAEIIRSKSIGDSINLKVYQSGSEHMVTLKLEAQP